MKIVAISGSIAEQSYNLRLLEYIQSNYSDIFEVELLDLTDVPLFNQDNPELSYEGPIHTINRKILQSDGVIIATPEHNHTIPAPLNNILDWLSFKIHPLRQKPVLILGASYSNQGTSRAQLHLRQILEAPGIDALPMPGNEFLLANCRTAFDENGQLKDPETAEFLKTVLEKFKKYAQAVSVLAEPAPTEKEDLTAQNPIDTTIEGVSMREPNWVEKASEITNASSGDNYVELDRGVLTVDQINWLLKSMPAELTFADNNNQYLYYNHKLSPDQMLAERNPADVGSSLADVHPENSYKNVSWVIQQLRTGNQDYVRMHIPTNDDEFIVHNYQAVHDANGKYRGINEIVFDLKPLIVWYLAETGQKLVKNGNLHSTTAAADISSGASESVNTSTSASEVADTSTGASEVTDTSTSASESDTTTGASETADASTAASESPDTSTGASESADTTTGASESY